MVHAEQRERNADAAEAAAETVIAIEQLLAAGVPADHITVVGASKGAYIATLISERLVSKHMNFVLLAGCSPGTVAHMVETGVTLNGRVLAIRDSLDTELAGSCRQAVETSAGIADYRELVVETGLEHGLIFTANDAWFIPAIEWATQTHDD